MNLTKGSIMLKHGTLQKIKILQHENNVTKTKKKYDCKLQKENVKSLTLPFAIHLRLCWLTSLKAKLNINMFPK